MSLLSGLAFLLVLLLLLAAYAYGRHVQQREDRERRSTERTIEYLVNKVSSAVTDLDRVARGNAFQLMMRHADRETFTDAELDGILDSEPDLGPSIQRNYAAILEDPELRDLRFEERIREILPSCRNLADEVRDIFRSANNDLNRFVDLFARRLMTAQPSRHSWTQGEIFQLLDAQDSYLFDCENALDFVLLTRDRNAQKSNFRERLRAQLVQMHEPLTRDRAE